MSNSEEVYKSMEVADLKKLRREISAAIKEKEEERKSVCFGMAERTMNYKGDEFQDYSLRVKKTLNTPYRTRKAFRHITIVKSVDKGEITEAAKELIRDLTGLVEVMEKLDFDECL